MLFSLALFSFSSQALILQCEAEWKREATQNKIISMNL